MTAIPCKRPKVDVEPHPLMARYTPSTALPAEELCRRLALVEQLHEEWADQQTDDLDPFDMWERLGHALAGGA